MLTGPFALFLRMLENHNVVTKGWSDYTLLDSGNNRKLERFGTVILDRPDPQALWKPASPEKWLQAHARFAWAEKGERWKIEKEIHEPWILSQEKTVLRLSLKDFKHIGVFPEHQPQWSMLHTVVAQKEGVSVLNLFGYTGAASIAAAHAGALVTHVDASKQTMERVKENSALSELPENSIRLITEDALKYVKRLVQRGEQFEVIIMDPPAFGRGPKGEVWKIEEKLFELVSMIPAILSPHASLVILNGYAAGFAARTFGELLHDILPAGQVTYGDVGIEEQSSSRVLSTGIYATWQPS